MNKPKSIRIFSFGGRGEIGKNMIVIEFKNRLLVLDAGVLFPGEKDYGIDLIIPDISYLQKNRDKILAVIFSHGHEDHIGAVPYIHDLLAAPLYGSKLTMALIKNKLERVKTSKKPDLNIINPEKKLCLGPFELEFCHLNHSIPGALATAINTSAGLIVYTGDYKFDQTPVNSPQSNFEKLTDWGKKGVLALLGDSTNSEREGYTLSEKIVAENITHTLKLIKQRIIIATFSSNIYRIQHILNSAYELGRKVAISGYSMQTIVQIASKEGYLDIPEKTLISTDKAKNIKPEELILLMTGSQGEYRASLSRIARGEHRQISLNPGDTILLSSSPIPGNEKAISAIINQLYSRGAEVIYNDMLDIHASGHACQEEIKLMINLIKPKYLIPVHGEFRHLYHHAQLGRKMGIPVENIFIAQNGDVLEINTQKGSIIEKIKTKEFYVEGNKITKIGDKVLHDRRTLSSNGFWSVIIPLDKENKIIGQPHMISRGFVFKSDLEEIFSKSRDIINNFIKNEKKRIITNPHSLKNELISILQKYFYEKTNRAPMILIDFLKFD